MYKYIITIKLRKRGFSNEKQNNFKREDGT